MKRSAAQAPGCGAHNSPTVQWLPHAPVCMQCCLPPAACPGQKGLPAGLQHALPTHLMRPSPLVSASRSMRRASSMRSASREGNKGAGRFRLRIKQGLAHAHSTRQANAGGMYSRSPMQMTSTPGQARQPHPSLHTAHLRLRSRRWQAAGPSAHPATGSRRRLSPGGQTPSEGGLTEGAGGVEWLTGQQEQAGGQQVLRAMGRATNRTGVQASNLLRHKQRAQPSPVRSASTAATPADAPAPTRPTGCRSAAASSPPAPPQTRSAG